MRSHKSTSLINNRQNRVSRQYHNEEGPIEITITTLTKFDHVLPTNHISSLRLSPQPEVVMATHSIQNMSHLTRGRAPHCPLAPPSLNAVLLHRQKPLTEVTRIKGTRLC